MTDREELLRNLQRQVRVLEDDLREQVEVLGELRWRLEAEYDRAFKLGRTAATWAVWRDDRVTQAAVAWVLGTVFVRFCEDNGLLPSPYLAGPSAERMTLAEEAQEQFFRVHPSETDRGWLLAAFDAIRAVPVGAFLFDERHNPLYQIPTSHDDGWSTTSPTTPGTHASSASCTKICRSRPRRRTRCCRPRNSSRSSFSTTP